MNLILMYFHYMDKLPQITIENIFLLFGSFSLMEIEHDGHIPLLLFLLLRRGDDGVAEQVRL